MSILKRLTESVSGTARRTVRAYPVIFALSIASCIASFLFIFDIPIAASSAGATLSESLFLGSLFALCASFFCAVLLRALAGLVSDKVMLALRIALYALSVLSIVPWAAAFYTAGHSEPFALSLAASCLVFLFLAVFTGARSDSDSGTGMTWYVNLLSSLLFAEVCALAVFFGAALCIMAISYLIARLKHYSELMLFALASSHLFVFVNTALSRFDTESLERPLPRSFGVVIRRILFPVFAVYLVLIYVYFVRILVTWTVPSNEINIFVAILSAGALALCFLYLPFEGRAAFCVRTIFPPMTLAAVVVQCASILYRVHFYGWTPMRFLGFMYALASLVAFVLLIVAARKVHVRRFVYLVFAAALFFGGIAPFNAYRVSVRSQSTRLTEALSAANLPEDYFVSHPSGELSDLRDGGDIDEDTYQTLRGAYNALIDLRDEKAFDGGGLVSGTRAAAEPETSSILYAEFFAEGGAIDLSDASSAVPLSLREGDGIIMSQAGGESFATLVIEGERYDITAWLEGAYQAVGDDYRVTLTPERCMITLEDGKVLFVLRAAGDFTDKGKINHLIELTGLLLLR